MAITKLGAQILGGLGKSAFEKTGWFGGSRPSSPPAPSMWQRIGNGFGRVGSFAMPGLMAFGAVNNIASGEQSVGGALGELGGGLAGWSLGSKAFGSLAKNMKPGFLKSGLGIATSLLTSGIGSSVGSGVGNAVLPFRRKPKSATAYWQDGYDGWSGRPDS